jgi:poly(3-hydroxybutyrate) depolymerase
MLFHGNPGSKEQMRGYVPFENVSKRDAFLVYPNASNGAWDLYTPTETNKDMSWIRDLPSELAARFNVDPSRVYGFGFSGGAFMMAQMGCRFGQSLFRAVMINSGGGPEESKSGYPKREDACYVCPGGPIPSLIVHGDQDGTVVKESGAFTAKCVAETNGCAAFPNAAVAPSPCLSAPGCQKPVEWCLIPKMGHAVWDQSMQAAWDFFRAN